MTALLRYVNGRHTDIQTDTETRWSQYFAAEVVTVNLNTNVGGNVIWLGCNAQLAQCSHVYSGMQWRRWHVPAAASAVCSARCCLSTDHCNPGRVFSIPGFGINDFVTRISWDDAGITGSRRYGIYRYNAGTILSFCSVLLHMLTGL